MPIVRGIIGAVLLFLGRELNFLFAGAMAGLIAFRLTPLLPPGLPAWSDAAFMITITPQPRIGIERQVEREMSRLVRHQPQRPAGEKFRGPCDCRRLVC